MNIAFLILEITAFYFTSKKVTSYIFSTLRGVFSKENTIRIYAIIFLPGTFIHEASHYLSAKLLFVLVRDFNIRPRVEGTSIQMGSVSIAKTDPVRRFMIGIAPVILGVLVVIYLTTVFTSVKLLWLKVLIAFVTFTIANSMFSSKKDMEGALKLFAVIFLIVALAYYLDISINLPVTSEQIKSIDNYFRSAALLLLYSLFLNIIIVIFSELLNFK